VIALLLLLAAAPFAGAFWDRDLGALSRELLERRGGPQAALFADLIRLCDCEALPPLETPDPLRILVRIEAARRARLGAKGSASDTIWRDVLRKDFFRRDPRNPPLESALSWPDEEELWTGEVVVVEPPGWRCDHPAGPPATQDDSGLAEALRGAGHREAASRFAYHRASRLLARGEKTAAADQARAIDPAALGQLGHWAALLRIQLGAGGPEDAVALARDWAGPDSLPARAVATDHLARQGRWAEVAELAAAAEGPAGALLQHVRLLRVRALLELSRREEALAALPRDARGELARDLALEAVVGRPLDAASIEVLSALWPDPAEAFARVAERALFAGSLEAARSAAAAIPPAATRARIVEAELAFATGNGREFRASLTRLTTAQGSRMSERLARGRAVAQLAGALASLAPAAPALRLEAAAAIDSLTEQYSGSIARDLSTAAAALRTRNAASAGVVRISSALPVPDLPPLQVIWPEPRSLLAIPDGEGGLRDWFPAQAALAGGPSP
jgi:hypothetical protein